MARSPHQVEAIIARSRRALEYLHPDNLPFRTSAVLKLGHAYYLQGDRAGARQAYAEVTAISAHAQRENGVDLRRRCPVPLIAPGRYDTHTVEGHAACADRGQNAP